MIIDLKRFIQSREFDWRQLEDFLDRARTGGIAHLSLKETERFNLLYRTVSSDLNRLQTFSTDPDLVSYLESLVSRAFTQMYQVRRARQERGWRRLWTGFPQAFRRHVRMFYLSAAVTLAGAAFGGLAVVLDPPAKSALIGFGHLQGRPEDRVAAEERSVDARYPLGRHAAFSTFLMTHNIKVSVFALALGFTFGVGTLCILFYNGVILGAVAADYLSAGVGRFLLGWLLPHGSIEIPAILIAGQAGFLIARCILERDPRLARLDRLRRQGPDLILLIGGICAMLVWAGFVESFLSQTHEPVLTYATKISIGVVEFAALVSYLTLAGRR